jgi:tetratricopeptide (TPR) repeat protein
LQKAIPLIPHKDERSRTRYVLAQLYQETGQDKLAYEQLNLILKRNPPYELDFFSKLMLGQVSDLNQNDRERLDKYFTKLLKDPKNKDYGDKIYYEMARLEYRQQRYDKALELLGKSVRSSTTNRAQRAYAYLLSGRIYFENLQKYRLAAAYYDSTTQNLPREAPEFTATAERRDILRDFAQQITTIETQDSLLTLARLDTATLRTRLLAYADAELLAKQKEAERQEVLAARAQNQTATGLDPSRTGIPGIDPDATVSGQQWYFDNPTALSTARGDFERRWGNRPLTDNWRLSSLATQQPGNNGGVPVAVGGNTDSNINPPAEAQAQADPTSQRTALAAQYRQQIPFTAEQQAQSQAQVEEAMYALAAIYGQQLHEPAKASETYEEFVKRFPQSKRLPEVYYSLYLLYKDIPDARAEAYAQKLRDQYPNSSYARLVADPEYLRRASLVNDQMGAALDSAFALYKKQEFTKATTALANAKKKYPQTELSDRADYLQVLLTLRTQPPAAHKPAVEAFVKKYPESSLTPKMQDYLATFTKYEAGQLAGALASTEKPRVSFFRPGEVDNRMRISTGDDNSVRPVVPAPVTPTPGKLADAPASSTPAKNPPTAPKGQPVAKPSQSSAAKPVDTAVTPPTSPQPTPPATTPPTTPATSAAPAAGTPPAPAPAPVSPYKADLSAPQAAVIAFPKDAAVFKDLQAQLTAYNNRFHKAQNLQVQQQDLGSNQTLLIVQPLPGAKVGQNYMLKLRGPQGPLMKLRNAGYQSFLIGIDNLSVLQQRANLEEYLQFFQQTYR